MDMFQNDLLHHFLTDIVSRTDLGVFAVGGAEEIRLLPLVVACDTVIQLLSAVGAVEQSRKGADNAAFRRPAAVLAKHLHQGEGFTVDNSGMGIPENLPFLWRSVNFLLVLEGLGGAAEVHRIAAVLLLAEYRQSAREGCKLTPTIINWEFFCRLHQRTFVNFL